MRDRLYIDAQWAEELISRLDNSNFFKTSTSDKKASRSDLFAFALALGVETDTSTALTALNAGGFILAHSLDPVLSALIYTVFLVKAAGDNLEQITQVDQIYALAEQYANTGFEKIDKIFPEEQEDRIEDIEIALDLLKKLDEEYERLFG